MLDLVLIGIRNLRREKIRSFLTVVGIVIGVATVFSLVSLSIGTQKFIEQQFEKFGYSRIIILPGGTETTLFGAFIGEDFREKDIKTLERISGIKHVIPLATTSVRVSYRDNTLITTLEAIPKKQLKILFDGTFELERGRIPRGKEVVLGNLLASQHLKGIGVGDYITLNGERFRVSGIMKSVGNRMDDTAVIIPEEYLESIGKSKGSYDMIILDVSGDVERVSKKVERALEKARGKNTFSVLTTKQLYERISLITNVVNAILLLIAAISLFVGTIGIMNTIYMSVSERIKEIGVMKAIGASDGQIMLIILSEAAALGLIGGIIGILLGGIIVTGVEKIAASAGATMFRVYMGLDLILGSLVFSVLLGIVAGYLPAKWAASLPPSEALRYE